MRNKCMVVPPTPSAAATYKVGSRGGLGHMRSTNPLKPRRNHLCRPLQPLQQKRPMWDLGLSQIFFKLKNLGQNAYSHETSSATNCTDLFR